MIMSFIPGMGLRVKSIGSNVLKGSSMPLSGMVKPVFITNTEFLEIFTGLSDEATRALRLPSRIIKNRILAMIIPVIVASVCLRKLFISGFFVT